jgi:hypothetical protein
MLDDCTIRIKRLQNGFTVTITDPAIVKSNDTRSSKSGECAPYKNPDVTYTFPDQEGAIEFIKENIGKAFPASEFDSTFDKAVKETKSK